MEVGLEASPMVRISGHFLIIFVSIRSSFHISLAGYIILYFCLITILKHILISIGETRQIC